MQKTDGREKRQKKKRDILTNTPHFEKKCYKLKTETPWGLSQVPLDWFNMDIKINIYNKIYVILAIPFRLTELSTNKGEEEQPPTP